MLELEETKLKVSTWLFPDGSKRIEAVEWIPKVSNGWQKVESDEDELARLPWELMWQAEEDTDLAESWAREIDADEAAHLDKRRLADEAETQKKVEWSVRRSRNKAMLAIRTLGTNLNFTTITYPELISDYDLGYRLFAEFVNRIGGAYFPGRKYVAIPERHKSGGLHWHIISDGFFDVDGFRTAWTLWLAAKGYGAFYPEGTTKVLVDQGAQDISDCLLPVHVHWEKVRSVKGCAFYVSKYITKSFTATGLGFGRQRYLRGSGVSTEPTSVEVGTTLSLADYIRLSGLPTGCWRTWEDSEAYSQLLLAHSWLPKWAVAEVSAVLNSS